MDKQPTAAATTETPDGASDRAERNWRVAKLLAHELGRDGRGTKLLADIKRELRASGGHCGEGTFECGCRRSYEMDLEKAIRVLQAALDDYAA